MVSVTSGSGFPTTATGASFHACDESNTGEVFVLSAFIISTFDACNMEKKGLQCLEIVGSFL